MNAILFGLQAKQDLNACIMYVTGLPCQECAKTILHVGIKKVYYGAIGSHSVQPDAENIVKELFALGGVELSYVGF